MDKTYIGIDNGSSGSIGIIEHGKEALYMPIPKIYQLDYQKTNPGNISRLEWNEFEDILNGYKFNNSNCLVVFERPFKNPKFFKSSISAARFYEAEICIVERFEFAYTIIDSKPWQKLLLPAGCKGKDQLKKASHDIGIRMFPNLKEEIKNQKDADGILIAEYARRVNL
jgi:hypothetical protein